MTEPDDSNEKPRLKLTEIVGSIFAAMFGVQSSKNRERDFKQGRAKVFIIGGIVFALLFVGTVYTVVQLVISGAGR